jgi:hypothetical protein
MSKVDDIKARLTVVELWARLYPNSAPKTGRNWIYKSPFREDKTPSFSIFSGGTRFRDHATGDAGDVISFASLAYGISSKEAIRKLSGEVCALPERRNIAPPTKKPELDVKEYERLVDQCLDGFRLDANTVLHRLLKAKNIPHEIAMSMRNEESLGCHQGCPAYIYDNGIKVRYSAESSRSTRWLIGSDGGLPWRYKRLSPITSNVILTEGESDAMLAMSAAPLGRSLRVLAMPNASWRPTKDVIEAIAKNRNVFVLADNDDAGDRLRLWLKTNAPSFQSQVLGTRGQDLCDFGGAKLKQEINQLTGQFQARFTQDYHD